MKTIDGICQELKTVDGVVGSFVLRDAKCLGSSLPPQFDTNRIVQISGAIARVSQISLKAGYQGIATAFHWQDASLLTWSIAGGAYLGLFALPTAVREAIDLSASIAVEDLSSLLGEQKSQAVVKPKVPITATLPPAPGNEGELINGRLRDVESLLIEELGPNGKVLLERCRNKTPRGAVSASKWLLSLRNAVLAEVNDPGARVTIATSFLWTSLD